MSDNWKENTWYLVDVSFNKSNPIHRALLFTGFIDSYGNPAGYNKLVGHSYDKDYKISDVYYIKPIRVVVEQPELECSSFKLPEEEL